MSYAKIILNQINHVARPASMSIGVAHALGGAAPIREVRK